MHVNEHELQVDFCQLYRWLSSIESGLSNLNISSAHSAEKTSKETLIEPTLRMQCYLVSVTVKEDIVVSVRRDGGTAKKNTDEYSYEINTQNVEAPQKAGAICGKLKLLRFDKEIAEYDLITSEDVEQSFIHSLFDSNNGKKHYFIIFTMIIIVLPIAAYLSFVVYIRRK